jgi:hypothetical protein
MVMQWILIGLALIAVFVVSKLIHFKHFKHRVTAIVLILLLFFAYASVANIIKNNSIDIKTPSGVFQVAKLYFSWLGYVFGNVRVVTGNVIRMDWTPGNLTG